MKLSALILLICSIICICGCETTTPQETEVMEVPEPCEPNLPEPPSEINDTICISITSEPNDALVYSVDVNQQGENIKLGGKNVIGHTPLEIPVKFWKNDEQTWLEGSILGSEIRWDVDIEERRYAFNLYLKKEGFYPVFINTSVFFEDDTSQLLIPHKTLVVFSDEYSPAVYNYSVKLIENNTEFAKKFVEAVEQGKFSYAEDLRLKRIENLREEIETNDQFLNNWPLEDGQTNDDASKSLIIAELDMLEHTIGLADSQLMEFRKRLVDSLQLGDFESAYVFARAVVNLEEKYFPAGEPYILELPYTEPDYQRSSYGAKNIAGTLSYLSRRQGAQEQ
ncbi:MAG: hypothetical protein ACYST2_05055, partial [Planctomycetota bacterium]